MDNTARHPQASVTKVSSNSGIQNEATDLQDKSQDIKQSQQHKNPLDQSKDGISESLQEGISRKSKRGSFQGRRVDAVTQQANNGHDSPVGLDTSLTPASDPSERFDNSDPFHSAPGSGCATPSSQSDQSLYLSSSGRGTPKRKRDSIDGCDSMSVSSGSVKLGKCPLRPGITWRQGEKLEAMDFMSAWYVAKIVDLDEEDQTVLIHFDGWNHRYDEWLDMSSERLRPITRHSVRKGGNRKLKAMHKVGEQVYAKWTDCKMYPAKISGINSDGSYEVIFYDGFKKTVQPINTHELKPDPEEQIKKVKLIADGSRRNSKKDLQKSEVKSEAVSSTKTPTIKEKERRRSSTERSSDQQVEVKKKKKKVVESTFTKKQISKPLISTTAGSQTAESDVQTELAVIDIVNKSADDIVKPPISEMSSTDIANRSSVEIIKSALSVMSSAESISSTSLPSSPAESIKSEKKTNKLRSPPSVSETGSESTSETSDTVKRKRKKSLEEKSAIPLDMVPPKAFVVENDHNRYKCVLEGCNKGFRKESLLQSHIKYYHRPDGKSMEPTKKRCKTTSVCSTDSDHSQSSKLVASSSRKKRHISAGSITSNISVDDIKVEVNLEDVQAVKHERTASQDTAVTEESGMTEDEMEKDEVVNCICGMNEENGLMIQCEVCLCWQHAACFHINETSLPKKYICSVCENPPGFSNSEADDLQSPLSTIDVPSLGIREGCHYIYEQEWFLQGQIPSFDFLMSQGQGEEKCQAIKATHDLIGDIHNLTMVLHAMKQKLKIVRNKDHPEFKLWKKDWDTEQDVEEHIDVEQEQTQPDSKDVEQEQIQVDYKDVTVSEIDSCVKLEDCIPAENVENQSSFSSSRTTDTKSTCENKLLSDNLSEGTSEDKTVTNEAVNKPDFNVLVPNRNTDCGIEMDVSSDSVSQKHKNNSHETRSSENSEDVMVKVPQSEPSAPPCGNHDSKEEITRIVQTSYNNDDKAGEMDEIDMNVDEKGDHVEELEEDEDEEIKVVDESLDMETPIIDFPVEGKEKQGMEGIQKRVVVEEDPFKNCEINLLRHIIRVQSEINSRLDLIEEQIAALENSDPRMAHSNPRSPLSDVPALKKSLRTIQRDLYKVKKMAIFH
ncbi:hypothetical protein ACJMK2_010836 [Sinanodonta woodiana]|uniref:C2H2-type domain-containing protein n=1 Tax=Sinanodonta woodiana TaxID=1069815 RepID=A0ABD3VGR1_SINWO